MLDFSTELQNAEVSVTLLKKIPPQALSLQFWKFSEQIKETLAIEVFRGGRIGQLTLFKRNATKDVYDSSFSKHPLKKF